MQGPIEDVGILADAIMADGEQKKHLVQLHILVAAEATTPANPAHERYRDRYEILRSSIAAFFPGEPGSDELSPEEFATLLIAVMDGLLLLWLYNPETVDTRKLTVT